MFSSNNTKALLILHKLALCGLWNFSSLRPSNYFLRFSFKGHELASWYCLGSGVANKNLNDSAIRSHIWNWKNRLILELSMMSRNKLHISQSVEMFGSVTAVLLCLPSLRQNIVCSVKILPKSYKFYTNLLCVVHEIFQVCGCVNIYYGFLSRVVNWLADTVWGLVSLTKI